MTIQVNLNGRKRRELANTVSTILNTEVSYKGPPTYEFVVGRAIISREGNVLFESKRAKDAAILNQLLKGLQECGFAPALLDEAGNAVDEVSDGKIIAQVSPQNNKASIETPEHLVVQMPLEGFDEASLQNLRLLVDSKAMLIKKSLGITELPIEKAGASVDFPWFEADIPQQELKAYTDFIAALCGMAKRQKRIVAVEKPTDNEKFTFRLFLVRLGLIGDEYADTRRILLQNLPGNGSWKDVDGKSTNPRAPKPDMNGTPIFNGTSNMDEIQWRTLFLKRLGYFLLHFDE
jgi:hypothetical protein